MVGCDGIGGDNHPDRIKAPTASSTSVSSFKTNSAEPSFEKTMTSSFSGSLGLMYRTLASLRMSQIFLRSAGIVCLTVPSSAWSHPRQPGVITSITNGCCSPRRTSLTVVFTLLFPLSCAILCVAGAHVKRCDGYQRRDVGVSPEAGA